MFVSIYAPGQHGAEDMPIFEGEASEAGKALVPGKYPAVVEGESIWVVVDESGAEPA